MENPPKPEAPEEPEVPAEPEVTLTNEEIKGIRNLINDFPELTKLLGDVEPFFATVEKAFLEYKKSGALDKIEKPEVTPEEKEMIMQFAKTLGVPDLTERFIEVFSQKLTSLKENIFKGQR